MQNGHRGQPLIHTVRAGGILAAGGGLLALVAFLVGPYLTYGGANVTGWHMVTVAKQIADADNDGSAPFLWWWGVPVCAGIALGLGAALAFKSPAPDDWEKRDVVQGRYLAAGVILAATLGVVFLVLPESQFVQSGDWNSMVLALYGPGAGVYWTLVGMIVAGVGGVMARIGVEDMAPQEIGENKGSGRSRRKTNPPALPAPTAPTSVTVRVKAEANANVEVSMPGTPAQQPRPEDPHEPKK